MEKATYENLLRRLIEIPTVSPLNPDNMQALATFLAPFGFQLLNGNLFVRGNPRSKLWIYSHADTKPPRPESGWSCNPFQLTERQGKWYGLGISDAKFQLLNAILMSPQQDCFIVIDCEEECDGEAAGLFMSQYNIDTLVIVDGARGKLPFYEGLVGQADGFIVLDTCMKPQHPGRKSESAFLGLLNSFLSEVAAAPFTFHITGMQSDVPERSLTLEAAKLRFDIRFIKEHEYSVQQFLSKWNAELKQWMPSLVGCELFYKEGNVGMAPFSNPLGKQNLKCRLIIVCPGAWSDNGNHRPDEFIYPAQVEEHQQSLVELFHILEKEGVLHS